MENYETCRRHHPEIALIQVTPEGRTTVHVHKTASLKFRVAACILLQNGQVDSVVRKMVQDYKNALEAQGSSHPLSYTQRVEALRALLKQYHNDQECTCSKKIEECTECDGNIMTHQEYYHYVEELRQRLHQTCFECPNVSQALFPLMGSVPDYGDAYQLRARTLTAPEGGFVAYEYFDEDEDAVRIVCEGESVYPRFPGYELVHALLENDTLDEAMEALSEDNPARGMLVEILE